MPVFVPLSRITDSPWQTRRHYDPAAIEALADSIERDGQLQHPAARLVAGDGTPAHLADGVSIELAPPDFEIRLEPGTTALGSWLTEDVADVLERRPDWNVQLAYGHRRARAWRLIWQRAEAAGVDGSQIDGLSGIPPGTMPVELAPLSDEQMFARAVGENAHRRDLSAVEEAEAMQQAAESFGWTHERIAEAWGYKDRSTVTNKLRLLKLPPEIRALNVEGLLPERTARALVSAFDLSDELAPHAHSQRLGYWLTVEDVVAAVEAGETHEGIVSKVRRYLDALEAEAARVKREREPEMFDQAEDEGQAMADAYIEAETAHREEVDPQPDSDRILVVGGARVRIDVDDHGYVSARIVDPAPWPISETGYRSLAADNFDEVTVESLERIAAENAKKAKKTFNWHRAEVRRFPEDRIVLRGALSALPNAALTAEPDVREKWLALGVKAADLLETRDPEAAPALVAAVRAAAGGDLAALAPFAASDVRRVWGAERYVKVETEEPEPEASPARNLVEEFVYPEPEPADAESDAEQRLRDVFLAVLRLAPYAVAKLYAWAVLPRGPRRDGLTIDEARQAVADHMAEMVTWHVQKGRFGGGIHDLDAAAAHLDEMMSLPDQVDTARALGLAYEDLRHLDERMEALGRMLARSGADEAIAGAVSDLGARAADLAARCAEAASVQVPADDEVERMADEYIEAETAHREETDPIGSPQPVEDDHTLIEPSAGAAREVEEGGIPPEAVEVSREAVIEEVGAHVEAARELRRLARHKSPERRREMIAEAEEHEHIASAKLDQFAALASAADMRAVCDALHLPLPASAERDAPAGLNQRERKLYQAIRDAEPRGAGYDVRPSDVKAAERLAELGLVRCGLDGKGWVTTEQDDAEAEEERDAPVSAETSAEAPWITAMG